MPFLQGELTAKMLRLQTQRENLIFALTETELSNEQRAQLHAQLSTIEDELLRLMSGLSKS